MLTTVSTPPYKKIFGNMKIRLPKNCMSSSGFKHGTERDVITQKLSSTIIETMRVANDSQGNQPTDWMLEVNLDPTFLYVDVHCIMRRTYDALLWRTEHFNLDTFRRNVEEAVHLALDKWAIQAYDVVVHCDDRRIWT